MLLPRHQEREELCAAIKLQRESQGHAESEQGVG